MKRASLSLLLGLIMLPAAACPVCDDPATNRARAAILNDQFARNVTRTLVPFSLLAAVVGVAFYRRPHPRMSSPSSH
jgi:hypothetical protein